MIDRADFLKRSNIKPSPAVLRQFDIMLRALAIYSTRNEKYRDNWRRMGLRGCLVRVRERSERLWDSLWEAWTPEDQVTMEEGLPDIEVPETDDAIDLINFACFLIRAAEGETTRDGEWWS